MKHVDQVARQSAKRAIKDGWEQIPSKERGVFFRHPDWPGCSLLIFNGTVGGFYGYMSDFIGAFGGLGALASFTGGRPCTLRDSHVSATLAIPELEFSLWYGYTPKKTTDGPLMGWRARYLSYWYSSPTLEGALSPILQHVREEVVGVEARLGKLRSLDERLQAAGGSLDRA